ncbi:MAG: hypothetical protein ABH846_00960 [Patescibacteria group bacterium]
MAAKNIKKFDCPNCRHGVIMVELGIVTTTRMCETCAGTGQLTPGELQLEISRLEELSGMHRDFAKEIDRFYKQGINRHESAIVEDSVADALEDRANRLQYLLEGKPPPQSLFVNMPRCF